MKQSRLSVQNYLTGNLADDMTNANNMANIELNTGQTVYSTYDPSIGQTIYSTYDPSKVLAVVKASLDNEQQAIELLEKSSKLEARLRRYKLSDSIETWSTRWVASPIAYLLPESRREEWLGDLYEVNREMIHKGYPRWIIHLINTGRTFILIGSSIAIKLSDLLNFLSRKIE